MKKLLILLVVASAFFTAFAINDEPILKGDNPQDTLKSYYLDEFVITTSVKETNDIKKMPTAVSVITPKQLTNSRIESLPDMSAVIPNFFIPSYGSKVSTPIYIRGMGARYGAQTVSLYVDNVPSFNPSAFDFEFQDIQRVEVLRGAQGTLYGRNAIGGIVNIYTLSPLTYQGTTLMVNGGNYGQFGASVSNYSKLSDKFGIAAGAYYKRNDGYFKNSYTGNRVDDIENVGGKVKLEWKITPNFKAMYSANYDHFVQDGFPYMHEDSTAARNNDPSSYRRDLLVNGLTLNYKGDGYSLNSTTGYQYLNDKMRMDQDYTELSVFSMIQRQKQHSASQEFTIKSENSSNYKWVYGLFGFIDNREIDTPVTLKEDAVGALQSQLDAITTSVGAPLRIVYENDRIELPGIYTKPVRGAAFFHQSTINNMFGVDGLSATGGIRFDYEHTGVDFFTESIGGNVKFESRIPAVPKDIIKGDTLLADNYSKDFWEILPKIALKYEFSPRSLIYISASKGYKSGGYNEQSFSKIMQTALQESLMRNVKKSVPAGFAGFIPDFGGDEQPLEEQIAYNPETSWTYELGGRYEMFGRRLSMNYSLFYSNVNNIQIIKLTDQGQWGRTVTNAGKSTSKGAELSIRYNPTNNFTLFSEYGYARAKFKNYLTSEKVDGEIKPLDYSGNYIPFAPQHTLSIGASYIYNFAHNSIIERMVTNIQHTGAGKIYWNDENTAHQPFYGLTNASVSIQKGPLSLEVWGKNIFAKEYIAFYFKAADMMGHENAYVQRGTPSRFGVTLKYAINR